MKKRVLWLATVAVTATVSSLATVAIADPPSPTTGTGNLITQVKTVAVNYDWGTTSSTTFTDVLGASRTITVGRGSHLLLARFSAQTRCLGSVPFDACMVRIVVDDGTTITQMVPIADGIDSVADCQASSGTCSVNEGFEYRAIERFLTVGPGTYTVKVQFAVQSSATTLSLSGGEFTVELSA